ncbi:MAG: lysylphosphatidylglycerol synthase transmembrane domain-containing protein [Gemmatimonadota bacterium]
MGDAHVDDDADVGGDMTGDDSKEGAPRSDRDGPHQHQPDLPEHPDHSGEGIPRTRRLRRIGLRIVQLLLTVAVTGFILAQLGVSLEEVRALDLEDWRPDWLLLLLSSLLLLAGYLVSAAFWGRMVAEMGGPRLSLRVSCRVYFISNLARYVPGKVWQLAGLSYLARREGVPVSVATGSAVLGHGMALGGAAIVGSLALFGGAERFRVPGAVALVGILGPLLLLTIPPLFRRLVRLGFRLLRQPAPEHLRIDPWFGIRWLALYVVNWAMYSIAFWVLVRSFHLGGNLPEVASAFSAAYLLGYVAVFAPAGIGVREATLVALLQPVHGVAIVGIAVIARLWTVVVELLVALGFLGEAMRESNRMHR